MNSTIYIFDEFQLEAENLLLLKDSEVVALAPKAIEVLRTLIEADGKLVTKQRILDKVWADTFVEESNLPQHISALRKALGEDRNGKNFIETIPRRGYRFVAEINDFNFGATENIISERTRTAISETTGFAAEENLLETVPSPPLPIAETFDVRRIAPPKPKSLANFDFKRAAPHRFAVRNCSRHLFLVGARGGAERQNTRRFAV